MVRNITKTGVLLDTYGSMTLPRHVTLKLLLETTAGWHASIVPGQKENLIGVEFE
jgi:hypothetical protein